MIDKSDISKLSSDYILKEIFSYIKYKEIFKLIKYNKALQKRLFISNENYKKECDLPKYEYVKEEKVVYERLPGTSLEGFEGFLFICRLLIFCPFFIYLIVYSILLVSLKTFNDNNIKENSNKSYKKIILIINPCLFIFIASKVGYYIFSYFLVKANNKLDQGIKKSFKWGLVILFNLINLIFEALVIYKLVLSYKIKKKGIRWFMIMDYIFIFINFFHIIVVLNSSIEFFCKSGYYIKTFFKLTSFNNIKINDFQLPDNFDKLKKNERKKFVLDNYLNYKYFITDNNIKLINSFNDFRKEMNIKKLEFTEDKKIPEFILNLPSEMILFPEKNIFKISNKNYILKYKIGELYTKFQNKNPDIIKILNKDNLNKIQIIDKGEYEYISISEHNYEHNEHKLPLIEVNPNNLSSSSREIFRKIIIPIKGNNYIE